MEGIAIDTTGGVPLPERPQAPPINKPDSAEAPPKTPTRSTNPQPLKTVSTSGMADSNSSAQRLDELTDLKAEISKLSSSQGATTDVTLRLDEVSKEPVITVTDRESGRILKEFPPSELRKVRALLADLAGVIVDKEA